MISIYIDLEYYNEFPYQIGGWKSMPCWPKYFYYKQPHQIYTDLDQYQQSTDSIKIAFDTVQHRLPPGNYIPEQLLQRKIDRIKLLSQVSNLVFAIETEVHTPALVENPELVNIDNLYWIMAGTVDSCNSKIIPWQYHIWRINELYKDLPGALDQLQPYATSKPKYFDAMLGMKKEHRAFVFDQIKENGLENKIVHAMGPMPSMSLTVPMNQGSEFIWEPDFEPLPDMDYLHLNQHIKYRGLLVQMPCIIPTQLFNSTAYSIICETCYENGTHMLSEKTAKALLGRRLFVMFSGAGMLKFIRNEGFKTFDGIIDESYDDIKDNTQRWTAAFNQVKKLCSMDQNEIFKQVQPICEHNFKHALDLESAPKSKIQNLLNNLT